jgi:hypothetical protein
MLTVYQKEKVAELLFTGECFIEKDSFNEFLNYLELGNDIKFEYSLKENDYYFKTI